MTDNDAATPWWSLQRVVSGEGIFVTLDALDFCVFRFPGEWQVAYRRRTGAAEGAAAPEVTRVHQISDDLDERSRFTTDGAADEVRLLPRVADRSVVARPRVPLHVLPDEAARIFVSSPVWVEATVGESGRSLMESPVRRLSDTWFGPSTREGVVAYSLKTQARTRAADMPHVGFRVVTAVNIRNDSPETLTVDRINLPVPYLSIYEGEKGRLWTESVGLSHTGEGEFASLDVHSKAPPEAGPAERLSGPREQAEQSLVVRAFSTLLRPFESGGEE